MINLLWSGGWDSTFRLLCLLLIEKEKVRPFYLIDYTRASAIFEIQIMEDIREILFRKYNIDSREFLPIIIKNKNRVKDIKSTNDLFKLMVKTTGVHGSQWIWLTNFVIENAHLELELALERITPDYGDTDHVRKYCKLTADILSACEGTGHNKKIKKNLPNNKKYLELFRAYRFPIIHITKPEMKNFSIKHGFDDIMRITWNCLTPVKEKPCGICDSCRWRKRADMF